jgi:hypothetical protein
MIASEDTIRQIRWARTRRRVVHMPVRRGALNEVLKCPMREGGVYRLVPCSAVEHKRRQARRESVTRAQAVCAFIDLVQGVRRTERQLSIVVTVTAAPTVIAGVWHVPVSPGDLSGQNDRALFLSSIGDYTFSHSRQAVPGDPEVMFPSDADLERARRRARERQSSPASATVRAMRENVDTLRGAMLTMKAETRRKLIAKELEKLAREVDGELVAA